MERGGGIALFVNGEERRRNILWTAGGTRAFRRGRGKGGVWLKKGMGTTSILETDHLGGIGLFPW